MAERTAPVVSLICSDITDLLISHRIIAAANFAARHILLLALLCRWRCGLRLRRRERRRRRRGFCFRLFGFFCFPIAALLTLGHFSLPLLKCRLVLCELRQPAGPTDGSKSRKAQWSSRTLMGRRPSAPPTPSSVSGRDRQPDTVPPPAISHKSGR